MNSVGVFYNENDSLSGCYLDNEELKEYQISEESKR